MILNPLWESNGTTDGTLAEWWTEIGLFVVDNRFLSCWVGLCHASWVAKRGQWVLEHPVAIFMTDSALLNRSNALQRQITLLQSKH